jgi:two-component system, NtrC family, nitrogen regulation sensor histidine kinase GlnL
MRGLAHEIKNPLGGLRGAAQLLERELPDKSLKEYTRIIIHEADRLRNLVDRMVGPHKPLKNAAGQHPRGPGARAQADAGGSAGGPRLERDYDPSLPEFEGEPEQLTQAVLNIARNSAEAIQHQGTIRLRTAYRAQLHHRPEAPPAGAARRDRRQRPGHPRGAARAHFSTRWSPTKPGGTGLGLSIAQDIVASMAA